MLFNAYEIQKIQEIMMVSFTAASVFALLALAVGLCLVEDAKIKGLGIDFDDSGIELSQLLCDRFKIVIHDD